MTRMNSDEHSVFMPSLPFETFSIVDFPADTDSETRNQEDAAFFSCFNARVIKQQFSHNNIVNFL